MRIFVIFVSFILGASSSYAASFNCAKASTLIENAICSDAELSNLDSLLGKAYKKARTEVSDKKQVKNDQKKWLANIRNKCADSTCLKVVYAKRITELEAMVNGSEASLLQTSFPSRLQDIQPWLAQTTKKLDGQYEEVKQLNNELLLAEEQSVYDFFNSTQSVEVTDRYQKYFMQPMSDSLEFLILFEEKGDTTISAKTAMSYTSSVSALQVGALNYFATVEKYCMKYPDVLVCSTSQINAETDIPIVIEDDLDAQVAEFLRPPSEQNSRGSWTVLGPVNGQYNKYVRAISRETDCRMGCNLLLLDYNTERPDVPTVNIAVGVLSTAEEVLGSVYRMYNIFVDGRKVGRIQFSPRVSQQGGYVILAYDACASIDNVYSKMKKGKQVSFISDDEMSRFDFALDELGNAEGLFK